MDALPPNDPNGNNGNSDRRQAGKGDPSDRSQRRRDASNGTMDVFGDLSDQPAVVVMFLVGVAAWLLREQCTC